LQVPGSAAIGGEVETMKDVVIYPSSWYYNACVQGFLEGMPVGLQLIGRAFDEGTLLRAAYAFEQHSDYHQAKPDLGGELI
jgi:hypothetical protein